MKSRAARTIFVLLAGIAGTLSAVPLASAEDVAKVETIALIRHGEKPATGLGQLDCQGLNRALALPAVIRKAFGQPAAIFAPNPAEQKADLGTMYDYVRPLATVEPAAIVFGLPIHADIGQSRIDDLRQQLDLPIYHDAVVLVGWEHRELVPLAQALLQEHGGDPKLVPKWNDGDFDSIYLLKIRRSGTATTASFEVSHEGLNGQPTSCPGGAG
ncbi:MAG: hypothetical protein ABSE20_28840 [Acetobacteraceae bacterium]|jgi:hypothetical protein